MLVSRPLKCLLPWLACLVLAPASPALASSQASTTSQDLSLDRAGRAARDARVSFSAGAAERGRALLLAAEADPQARQDLGQLASALMSVGGGGDARDLELLERFAETGKLSLRRAALFALGELGVQGFAVLDRLLGAHLVGAEEVALLALIHMDQGSRSEPRVALQRVLDACDDPRPGVSQAALFLREYALGGPAPAALPALDAYYDLRWQAACDFGFVDGLRWKDLKLSELLADVEYLNRFVLGLAGDLDQNVLASHVVELLAYPHGPGCAAGIAKGMPGVIPTLYNDAGWRPASLDEWIELIDAIELLDQITGYEPFLTDALRKLPDVPHLRRLRDRAALLLIGAGQVPPVEWINQAIKSQDHVLQARLLELGGGSEDEFMRTYARQLLAETKSPSMRIRAQIAMARQGDEAARTQIEQLFREGQPGQRLMALECLVAVSKDPAIRAWTSTLVEGLELGAEEQWALTYALAWGPPSLLQRGYLREALRSGAGTAHARLRTLKLLLDEPVAEDLELFRELFPVEGDLEFNLLLGEGLSDKRDNHSLEALRRVLWGSEWNLTVLAGGIATQRLGVNFLMDELARPPGAASDSQLRSVGFALGEWAGLTAVEELARTQTARDPALQGAFLGALSASGQ